MDMQPLVDLLIPPPRTMSPWSTEWEHLLGARGPENEVDVARLREYERCEERVDDILSDHGFDILRQVWKRAKADHRLVEAARAYGLDRTESSDVREAAEAKATWVLLHKKLEETRPKSHTTGSAIENKETTNGDA